MIYVKSVSPTKNYAISNCFRILLGIIISEIECKILIIYFSLLVNIAECFKIFSMDELKKITLKQSKKQNAQYGHKK